MRGGAAALTRGGPSRSIDERFRDIAAFAPSELVEVFYMEDIREKKPL